MRRSTALPALAATVVALALAGCTGGTSSASADEDGGPLTAFYEKLGGSFEDEDYERQQREVEEIIAACMTEQGFEYTPAEPTRFEEPEGLPEWDSKEYAEQYGYGATTTDEIYGDDEYVDPNADYLATMSESEQAAFYEALYGSTPEVDPEADPEAEMEWNWEEQGCSGKASHEVYEMSGGIWEDPEFTALSDEMSTEYENLADEPAVRKAQDAWVTCIAEAGFDFSSPDEPQQEIYDELNAIWEASAPAADAEVDPDASYEPDPAAMAELKEKELKLAAADFACKESSGFTKAQNAAYSALEKRMWDKYGERLEAVAAKYESKEK